VVGAQSRVIAVPEPVPSLLPGLIPLGRLFAGAVPAPVPAAVFGIFTAAPVDGRRALLRVLGPLAAVVGAAVDPVVGCAVTVPVRVSVSVKGMVVMRVATGPIIVVTPTRF
jgi:hypothetical protein